MRRFLLGTHQPDWLWNGQATPRDLFVSARRLRRLKTYRRAVCMWALDSGGFSELSMFGWWRTSATQYASEVRSWSTAIGGMLWAAQQDWMCEPQIVAKTGLSVREHQRRTVHNYLLLRQLAPSLPIVPVVQGFTLEEYLRCVSMFSDAGVDLSALPIVGVGSVCRRQGTADGERIVRTLADRGIPIHAFGVKVTGLKRYADAVVSADSMAWSIDARRAAPLPGCTHKNCANCPRYASRWCDRIFPVDR